MIPSLRIPVVVLNLSGTSINVSMSTWRRCFLHSLETARHLASGGVPWTLKKFNLPYFTICIYTSYLLLTAFLVCSSLSNSVTAVHQGDVTCTDLIGYVDVLVPVLLDCWIEAGPSQLTTNMPGIYTYFLH